MKILVKSIMHNSIVRNIEANSLIARIIPTLPKGVCVDLLKNIYDSDTKSFFDEDIRVDDIYRFSDIMRENMEYDCALGLYSYTPTKEKEESFGADHFIIGIYHHVLPYCYFHKYSYLKDCPCIEIENDVLFLSPSDSTFENFGVEDGSTVRVKPTNALNLLGFCK